MTGDYQPREHDHLIEPMIDAVHGQQRQEVAASEPPVDEPPVSWSVAWAPLLVPLGGFALAILVWAAYRLFS